MSRTLLPILLLVGIVSIQYYFDLAKKERPLIPPVIIPAQTLKLADLGLHSAASAMIWIYTIQQVATYPRLIPSLIGIVTELDPKFSYPYAFAAIVLPSLGFPEQAVGIAKMGIEKADSDWRIPYYLATTYHIFFQDRENAAFYFDLAANTPRAPEKIRAIAARYGTSENMLQETKQIWISIYETSDDELLIERARNYIIHIEMIEALEKAIILYKQRYGYNPKEIEDLVTGKILKAIPESPLGVEFGIKPNGDLSIE